jgi:hypothetical protein
MRPSSLIIYEEGIEPRRPQSPESTIFSRPAIAGIREPELFSGHHCLRRPPQATQGEIAHRLSLYSLPSMHPNSILALRRSSPPRECSPELSPVTICWGRRLHCVQRTETRPASLPARLLLAGITVADNTWLAGDVLLCPVSNADQVHTNVATYVALDPTGQWARLTLTYVENVSVTVNSVLTS